MLRRHIALSAYLIALAAVPTSALAQCGVERWSVKTGTDADVGLINLNSTTPTTISSLASLPQPSSLPSNNRIQPTEITQFQLNVTLVEFKLESDSDYHLVLQDSSGNTMISEIPAPSCVGAGSPLLPGITNARAQMDAKYTVTTSFTTVNVPVTITGIGFFDFLHGQTGVAPNGIEIHPVLNITFGGGGNPSFSMSANPTSLSVAQGGTGTSTISTTVTGGFNNAISLSASGVPSGVTASFNPSTIAAPGSGTSTVTFSASGVAPPGTYPITVTGTGGGLTQTASISLTIPSGGTPTFSLGVSPPALTVAAGSSGTVTTTTTVSGGFNSSISLSASGMPTGVTASFNPTSIAAPGAGSSTLTLSASSAAAAGTYPITVTGTGGGQTQTATLNLTVSAGGSGNQLITDGGFESATSSGLTAPGWTATTNISGGNVIIANGAYPHSGSNYASLGGSNNQNDTLTQTISVPTGTTSAPLTFWVSINTQETGTTPYDYLYVEIHDASGNLLATPLTLENTYSTSSNNTLGTYFQPTTVDLTQYAGQTIQIVFHATTDYIMPTTFLIDDVSVLATAPGGGDFALTVAPSSVSVAQASSTTSTVTTTVSGNFNSSVSLSASGLPSGATASFSPSSIAAPGSGSSTLTITAASSTPLGVYSVTISATGAGHTHTATLSLTVNPAGGFTIAASPPSLTINQGASGASSINSTITGGFNSPVSLSASGLPSGVTASFNPTTIAAPGSGSSTMTLNVGSSAATGTYTITVIGSGGGMTHTATLSLTVNSGATPNFAISAAPSSLTINQGSSGTSTISTTVSGGFNSAVSLSASGLPSGASASFSPTSIAAPGSGSSMMTISVGASTAAGNYTVTVTGSGGGITHTATVALAVTTGSGGSQLITDGGFESATKSGNSALGWTATTNISGHNVIVYHGSYPHSGQNYSSLGGSNNETDTLTQTITVPAGTKSASLTFWVNITTQETTTTKAYDYLYVEIHNSSGTLLATPLTLNNLNSSSDKNTLGVYFQPQSISLSAYASQAIEVVFHATTDYTKPTTFLIDDVSVVAQ